ncbi:MAG: hypothetical protein E7168_01295 [Firmicutes bacterium]|nr:hypothetical protein [Bacillota bacterium]
MKVNTVNFSGFNKYLDMDDYVIYLSNNIKEIYYVSSNVKYTLKEYNTNVIKNSSDIIKELIDLLDLVDTLKDGGNHYL